MHHLNRRVFGLRLRRFAAVAAWSTACAAAVMTTASRAQAADWIIEDPSEQSRSQHLDFTVSAWGTQFGFAGWFAFPVVPQGFIAGLNDSFDVEGGAFLSYFMWGDDSFLGLTPLVGGRWKFHLSRDWTAFATAKMGAIVGLGYDKNALAAGGSIGAYWHARDDVLLRIESGYPGGFQVGASFPL